MAGVHGFSAAMIDGKTGKLSDYAGRVLLVVNTASRCMFTPQLQGLEALYQRFKDRGFAVLGFPCNQFGEQEPGSDAEIAEFCETNFSISFPLFAKVEVNGDGAHPLFKHLKAAAPGLLGTEGIKWNFTKFLVGRDGKVIARFAPNTVPQEIAGDIDNALQA